jgi:hypothetical protein
VSRVHPGQASARDRHGEPTSAALGLGWCLPCYEAGAFSLEVAAGSSVCVVHGAGTSSRDAPGLQPLAPSSRLRGRLSRGRAWRTTTAPPARQGRATFHRRHDVGRRAAQARAYGRRRAAARVDSGHFAPHPGWRNFIEPGWRVLVDQSEAWSQVQLLVDAEEWRADKRASWSQILRQMVQAMDWTTGLVTGVTATRLGAAGERATRTVSRVLAWARDVGLVVVVEPAASAEFLGSRHNRCATYALVTSAPRQDAASSTVPAEPTLDGAGDENGDLPLSLESTKPSNTGKRLKPPNSPSHPWPTYAIPTTPAERNRATQALLRRLGLDPSAGSRVPLWRARALLKSWFEAGACIASLLYALDHHPDRQDQHRGDALRAARDPLRVLGHRLQPWRGRLNDLPITLVGFPGDYTSARHAATATSAEPDCPPQHRQTEASSTQRREAAKAALATHLAELRRRRGERPRYT